MTIQSNAEQWEDSTFKTFAQLRLEEELLVLRDRLEAAENLNELAWGIIANAYGGDWSNATEEWHRAAAKWREHWHAALDKKQP